MTANPSSRILDYHLTRMNDPISGMFDTGFVTGGEEDFSEFYPVTGFSPNDDNLTITQQQESTKETEDLLPLTSKAYQMKNNSLLMGPHGSYLPMGGKTMTDLAIVLDLDETCVRSFIGLSDFKKLAIDRHPDLRLRTYQMDLNDVVTSHGQGEVTKMWGIKRPHIDEFLVFCFSYFRVVIVWSAGKYKYVHAIANNLFADIVPPHLVLTWNDCDKVDGICDKDLSKIYNHPELKGYVRPENTLIVDDRLESFKLNTPENGILIPAYKPSPKLELLRAEDIALLQLQAWFQTPQVMNSTDVRILDKSQIFKTSMNKYYQTSTPGISGNYFPTGQSKMGSRMGFMKSPGFRTLPKLITIRSS